MKTRLMLVACIAVALGSSAATAQHGEPNNDSTRCDTWYRQGHEWPPPPPGKPPPKDSHGHESGSDVKVGDPAHTVIHGQSGHYVVRNDYGYVEVVGGQAYRGPDPNGNSFPGQGGYVQGEIDVAPGVPDADYNVAFFGPDFDHLPAADPAAIRAWAEGTYGRVCVNAGGNQQEIETRRP